jgi:HlyD family secretion protein
MRDTSGQDTVLTVKPAGFKKIYVSGFVILALVTAAALASPKIKQLFSTDLTISKENLRFATVTRGDLVRDISVQGKIVAANSPTLYAPSSGIVSLVVKAGDAVQSGQMLALIDSPELRNRYSQEQSSYDRLMLDVERQKIQLKSSSLNNQQQVELSAVNLNSAKVNLHRAEVSIASNLISQKEYEERVADFKRAELTHSHAMQNADLQKETMAFELKSKQSELVRQALIVDELERQVAALTLTAPTQGIIGTVHVREKDKVAANSPLITVIDLSLFEVEINIPENYADDLGVGLAAEVNFNNNTLKGELMAISPEVNNGQVTGRIRFIDADSSGFRQNQRVNARVLIESKIDVLKVKTGAFVNSGGRLAFVVQQDSAKPRVVELGARSIGEVEILTGLTEGEQIIISSIEQFTNNQHIYLTN